MWKDSKILLYRLRWCELALLTLFSLLFTNASIAAGVVIVSDQSNELHQQFVRELSGHLGDIKTRQVETGEADTLLTSQNSKGALYITVGQSAAELLSRHPSYSVLHTLITEPFYRNLYYSNGNKHHYVAYLEQPVGRYMNLIDIALPGDQRIGVVETQRVSSQIDRLRNLAPRYDMEVVSMEMGEGTLADTIDLLLHRSDLFLALPDPEVVNRLTVKLLILSAFHERIPLVGYSAALVKAGAVMAVHSTTTQLAHSAAITAVDMLKNRNVSRESYPRFFSVSVNYQVARALDLDLDTEEVLQQRLISMEDGGA